MENVEFTFKAQAIVTETGRTNLFLQDGLDALEALGFAPTAAVATSLGSGAKLAALSPKASELKTLDKPRNSKDDSSPPGVQ